MASTINSSSISTTTLDASTIGSFPAGHILQVQNYFTNAELTCVCAANQVTDLGSFTVSITPSSSSNKILVMLSLAGFNFSSTNYGIAGTGALRRKIASGSFTSIGVGQGNSNFNGSFNLAQINSYQYNAQLNKTFLDSPSTTSTCTYGIAVADHNNGTQTFYLNRMGTTGDNPYSPCLSSSIIVMEVVA
tara:strand:+ start:832 stop:1401 length:570 start_codon:yes stop_codon:yes gene_type:complete